MLVVAGLLLVVAVVLAVVLVRSKARLDAVSEDLGDAIRARQEADTARRAAEADAATARKERDDALERASRARRDAADVAKRMKQEAEARAAADAARLETEAERQRLAVELRAAEEAVAAGGGDEQVAELWSLALAGARRTWEISVSPSPGMPSPLDDTDDELRTAVEIEVDAAREEAGAAIELEWRGDAVAAPAVAVRALSIVQELVARLAKTSDDAVLRVSSTDEGVTIEVEGTDDEGRPVVPADVAGEHQVAPGRFVLLA